MQTITLSDLTYKPAIHHVSDIWTSGELVGLVGPNGAGKSSLLRLAAGVWRPDNGSVCIDGSPIHSWSHRQRARRIAYLPQHLPDDIPYTVRQFVEMGRFAHRKRMGGLSANCVRAVESALDRLDLLEQSDVPLSRLSGGERQRVALARCLAQETKTLLLDEPISNLDLYYQMDILRLLGGLVSEGMLVVVAIHHLEFAAQFCTRLVLMHHGTIAAAGEPESVLTEESVERVFRTPIRTYRDPHRKLLRFTYE